MSKTWLPAVVAAVVLLGTGAPPGTSAQTEAPGCKGTQIPNLLEKARRNQRARAFATAIHLFEELEANQDFDTCTPQLRFKVWKEHGDAHKAQAARQIAEASEVGDLEAALGCYREALAVYRPDPWEIRDLDHPEEPRVVLNAIVETLFGLGRLSELCDYIEEVAQKNPDLLDSNSVDVWRKAIVKGWAEMDRPARLEFFCTFPGDRTRIRETRISELKRECST
jgi:hypothetical protein